MAVLLDTCVLIDLIRRHARAEEAVLAFNERPFVCHVSMTELVAGARSQREEQHIAATLKAFRIAPIDEAIFVLAGQFMRYYRSSHALDLPDALIAATAQHHTLNLATLNVKHFPMFKRLKAPY